MKLINIILLIILFIINCENVKSIDCSFKPEISKLETCGKQPELHVKGVYYSFENVYMEPYLKPILVNNDFYYLLTNGVEYTLNIQNKGCDNNVTETFKPNGMYYELISQPKCYNTLFEFQLFNYYLNGSSKVFSTKQNNFQIANENLSCFVSFVIYPQSGTNGVIQSGAVKVENPTCGFDNGSITVDLTKGYSNVRLFRSINDGELNDEVQPGKTAGSFENLSYNGYVLSVESEECGNEIVKIEVSESLPVLNIEIKEVPNLYDFSTFSFSLSTGEQGILNSTNSYVFVGDSDDNVIGNWTDYSGTFNGGESFDYGYYYNDDFLAGNEKSCSTYEKVDGIIPVSVLKYTITKHGDSCLNDLLLTVHTFSNNQVYLYDFNTDSLVQFEDGSNQTIIPYNRDFSLHEKYAGPIQYFSTVYKVPTYSLVETTKGGLTGCWRTFNITINDYESLIDLQLNFNYREDSIFYPVDGVFIDVPSGPYEISYFAGDCETKSFFTILNTKEDECNQDVISFTFKILKNATCSQPYEVEFIASTPIGILTNSFTVNSLSYVDDTWDFPNSLAYVNVLYYNPKYLIWDDNEFNITIGNNAKCNFTYGSILLSIPNDPNNPNTQYNVLNVFGNDGKQPLTSSGPGLNYFVPPGENNIIVQYYYGNNINNICYKSNSVHIDAEISIKPQYTTTSNTNCQTPNGKIIVSNYQEFKNISIELPYPQSFVYSINGEITNLRGGDYYVFFESESCNGFVTINVPTSEDNVEIETTIIQNPTCVINYSPNNADGKIRVNVKKDGVQLDNLRVSDIDDSYSEDNVYIGAKVGSNSLMIQSGNCTWYRDVNIEKIDDPMFSIETLFNETCGWSYVYKLNVGNPNVVIKQTGYSNGDINFYQGSYYLVFPGSSSFIVPLEWNSICSDTFLIPNRQKDQVKQEPPIQYEIVKADNCHSLKIDIIIKNMNEFTTMLLFRRKPESINSTHAIFRNLPPNKDYFVEFFKIKSFCNSYQIIGAYELSSGLTKESLNIKKSNDMCYTGIGKIEIQSPLDTDNYYYSIQKYNGLMIGDYNTNTHIDNDNVDQVLSNLPVGIYNITRICKSVLNCFIREKVEIKSENPSIQSITINHSYSNKNNGTVEIKLNFNPTKPVTYEILNTKLSNNNGIFSSLSPNTYQIKITITDRMCPVTLLENFTIDLIPTPKPVDPSVDPSEDPSDELSTSTFLQVNHVLLLLIILILTIIF
ncbi:hypothetical protein ACTFIZ_001907 [Dictyostelium cf. discoideum]